MWRVLAACSFFALVPLVSAQSYGNGSDGALAPVTDVTLDTTANNGVFQFTSVHIPSGVTVHLIGANAATFLCQGTVTIAGTLEADGQGSRWLTSGRASAQTGGPGGYDGGAAFQDGAGPGGGGAGICLYPAVFGTGGAHTTAGTVNPCSAPPPTYGAALPFDLRGGSGGGGSGMGNLPATWGPPGSGGGGTIAILANGAIDIAGTVSARGGDIVFDQSFGLNRPPATGGNGAGGTILLRSLDCVTVSGRIDATGGVSLLDTTPLATGGDGLIRIDSYTACGVPVLAGATIRPAAFVAPLPFLTQLEPARIGRTYRVRCASAPGDVVGFYYSFAVGLTPLPPFGVLELDPTLILTLGLFSVPNVGVDPLAVIDILVPATPVLVGLAVHAQTFNAFGTNTGHPRLSNLLTAQIGN